LNPNLEKIVTTFKESEWEVNFHKNSFIIRCNNISGKQPLKDYIKAKEFLLKTLAIENTKGLKEVDGKILFINFHSVHCNNRLTTCNDKIALSKNEVHELLDMFDVVEKR